MLFISAIFLICMISAAAILAVLTRMMPADFLAAKQNARSNHSQQARQIGGLAVIPACIIALLVISRSHPHLLSPHLALSLAVAALLLWIIGYLDDRNELSVRIRLFGQLLAASLALYALGAEFRLLPAIIPHWLEALLLIGVLVTSINATNFMDGLDWLTVSGLGLPLLLLSLICIFMLPLGSAAILAAILSGGLAGFALYNRPPARIFLGDSGSLPLGLLAGIALLIFAHEAGMIPALILPLYYIADVTSTIALRLKNRDNILQAHSAHAYQLARRSGKSVLHITTTIAALNLCLAGICALLINQQDNITALIGLLSALILTSGVILYFHRASHA